jgi:aminotransferase
MRWKSQILASRIRELELGEINILRALVKGVKFINLGYGEVDFDTPEYIREAAKKALDEGFTRYVIPIEGFADLREAIAEKLSRENGVDVNPDKEVLVTTGVQEGINLVMQTLLNEGDEVILADPCYMSYPQAIRYAGGIPVFVQVKEERDFRIDPEDVEDKVTSRTKLLVLVSPDNPTGAVLPKDDLEAIAEIALRHDLIVVSDEIYEKFIFGDHRHYSIASLPEMKERSIILNGFSKAYAMTGWRVGYIAADESCMEPIKRLHSNLVICANSIAQKAALAALTGPQHYVEEFRKEFERRMNLAVNGLNRIHGIKRNKPGGSFYIFPNVKSFKISSFQLAKHVAKDVKVLLYPGTAFGKGGEGYLRLSLTTSQDNIKEALVRIKESLEKLNSNE